ncbi:MAG: hypothetical protein CMO01_16920 [Thalassobius sp.]|nr:hypothetical protein [Thalassovita sp.]
MNIYKLSFRNMSSRPLSTLLSLILLVLGVGMISLLLQVSKHVEEQMENNIKGIDMVIGAKGSPLQLILSAVYHIDVPTGNIPLEAAEQIRNNRFVEKGIPLSYGDSYNGFRIVGTNHEYPELYGGKVALGKLWQEPFEVTIGITVAQNLSLKLGDTFAGSHGLVAGGISHKDQQYKVVGILNYSNSVLDRLILTATESVWEIHHHEEDNIASKKKQKNHHSHGNEQEHDEHNDHLANADAEIHNEDESHHNDKLEEEHHEKAHQADREITAMLINFRSPIGVIQVPRMVNANTNMQAAVPLYEIRRLFSLMGVGIEMLSSIAIIIMGVSGLSVFISLYNALKNRQYEMVLMRSYGASRWYLVWHVVLEGLMLTTLGFILGIAFSRVGLFAISKLVQANYHYSFSNWNWLAEEGWLLASSLSIGLLAAILPAIRAFNLNISKTLSHA